ncbi:MAG: hypothetical protein COB36_08885 [Alphaproteobacteria bacterium]|nr:MAG: hypothetical protein COB36_08885 [Alphaproteobacteria bacterium]
MHFLLLFVFLLFFSPQHSLAKGTGQYYDTKSPADRYRVIFKEYEVEFVDTLKHGNTNTLYMERAFVYTEKWKFAPIERIQFRSESGHVVAHTPTRLSSIPFCFTQNFCWVFMWKTVYPLPAIFKFNPDPQTWIYDEQPYMQYSRSRYAGEGFTEVTNPFFGLVGLVLFYLNNTVFFGVVILLSVALCLQLSKFHDIPDLEKKWYHRLILMINVMNPIFLPLEPYMLTAFIMVAIQGLGVLYWGIPGVLITLTMITSFLCAAMRIGKLKAQN